MKTIIIGLLLVVANVVLASDMVVEARDPFVNRGVSITKLVDGASTDWINEEPEPWYPVSVMAGQSAATTNVITIDVVRLWGVTPQYAATTVTTNFFGRVETNTSSQVTNTVTQVFTGRVASVTLTGNAAGAVAVAFQFKADDVIRITQSDTNAKPVVISGQR